MCASRSKGYGEIAEEVKPFSSVHKPQVKPQVQLTPYSEQYRAGVFQLLESVKFKPAIWSWQFEQNICDKPFNPIVATDAKGQVVGFNGVMPTNAIARGDLLDAIWSCDFYVDASYRGAGVGSLLKQGLSDRADLILALGVSEKAGEVLSHLGWKMGTRVFNYKRINNKWPPRNLVVFLIQLKNRMVSNRGLKMGHGQSRQKIYAQSQLPAQDEVDRLWSRVARDYQKIITRNFRYLDWRYQKHPLARYCFVVVRESDELEAIVVVRFNKGTLRLVDYCGPAQDQNLKDRLVAFCQAQWKHCRQFSATTSDPELGRSLLAHGYYCSRTLSKFYVRPRQGMEKVDPGGWFLMGGDSDGELLIAAKQFLETHE